MSPIDRALWNVAEAASRYSDSMADDARRQAWRDMEAAIASARALVAKATAPPAPSLPPEQLAAVQRTAEVLRERAEQAEQRRAEMEAGCWQMEAERDAARAQAEASQATVALLTAEIDSLKRALALAEAERAEAVVALDRSMMRIPDRPAPATARAQDPAQEPMLPADPSVEWARPDRHLDLSVEHMGVLAVKATSYNLLPDSWGEHLVPGARLLRQDGRMAAMIAVPCGGDGSMGPEATEQAGRLVAQGFRVDWVSEDELVA